MLFADCLILSVRHLNAYSMCCSKCHEVLGASLSFNFCLRVTCAQQKRKETQKMYDVSTHATSHCSDYFWQVNHSVLPLVQQGHLDQVPQVHPTGKTNNFPFTFNFCLKQSSKMQREKIYNAQNKHSLLVAMSFQA